MLNFTSDQGNGYQNNNDCYLQGLKSDHTIIKEDVGKCEFSTAWTTM